MHLRYLIEPVCVQYGRLFSQKNAFRIQRSRAQERGLSRGNLSPLTRFWFGVPDGSQDPMGRGGRTAAGRAARRGAEGQHDSSGGAPDEAVPRDAPPEEIAGNVTVRICGGRRNRSGRKNGRMNGARFLSGAARRAELRLAGGLARRQARRDGVMSICRQAPRINQKCAEYSRVKQWDGSPPPNCGEENENGA